MFKRPTVTCRWWFGERHVFKLCWNQNRLRVKKTICITYYRFFHFHILYFFEREKSLWECNTSGLKKLIIIWRYIWNFFSSRNNMKRILSYQNKFKQNPLSKLELDKNVYTIMCQISAPKMPPLCVCVYSGRGRSSLHLVCPSSEQTWLLVTIALYMIPPILTVFTYTFSSNHNIHKSSFGLCFQAPDPLIDRFY